MQFFSAKKVRRLATDFEILSLKKFEDPSPPFTKKLYAVVLRRP